MSNTYRELRVWQKAVDLAVLVYEFTAEFPKHELYGLSSQMRRAAVSVASNLAEGAARGTRKDFRHFVKLAEGSNSELQTQLLIARRLKSVAPPHPTQWTSSQMTLGKCLPL